MSKSLFISCLNFRFALLMLVMKLRNFFLKYPWNKVNWKSQFLLQVCCSRWLMQEPTKESKKNSFFSLLRLHFIYFAKSPCIWINNGPADCGCLFLIFPQVVFNSATFIPALNGQICNLKEKTLPEEKI